MVVVVVASLCTAPVSSSATAAEPVDHVIGTVTIPRGKQQVSVTIYDAAGKQPVRTLLEARPKQVPDDAETVELRWDGLDDSGNPVPAGDYSWKALASNVVAVEDEAIGQEASPTYGRGVHSSGVGAVATDAGGDVYESSYWEEFHAELRRWSNDGERRWGMARTGGGTALAVDDEFLYEPVDDEFLYEPVDGKRIGKCGQTMLVRYKKDRPDGQYNQDQPWDNWPVPADPAKGYIVASQDTPMAVAGLAVDDKYLYASLHRENQIRIYDKKSAVVVGTIAIPRPTGITIDLSTPPSNGGPRALWVASAHDKVVNIRPDGAVVRTIPALNDPSAVTMGGPNADLYIGEEATGVVRQYPVPATGQPVERDRFFGAAKPGAITDGGLRWPDARFQPTLDCGEERPDVAPYGAPTSASVAVLRDGGMVVADGGNSRVLTYNADGTVRLGRDKRPLIRMSDFTPYPQTDPTQDPDIVSTGWYDYRVPPVGTDTGREWSLRANWRPNGPAGGTSQKLTQRRTLANGKTYLYFHHQDGTRWTEITVYEYSDTRNTMRVVTTIGTKRSGELFVGADRNNDGVIGDDELTLFPNSDHVGFLALGPSAWVDTDGGLLMNVWDGNPGPAPKHPPTTLRIPVTFTAGDQGGLGDPKYDWPADSIWNHTMPGETSSEQFLPVNLKVDGATGDVYRHGWTRTNPQPEGTELWFGGSTIERRTPAGEAIRIVPRCTPPQGMKVACESRNRPSGLAAVAPDGDYFYTAHDGAVLGVGKQAWIKMYTTDGLVVTTFTGAHYGAGQSDNGYESYVDSAFGMTAYTHPRDCRRYVLAEDSFLNRTLRWHLDGMPSVERLNGGAATRFDWPYEPQPPRGAVDHRRS